MAEPTFFSEGNEPRRPDTLWKIDQKILGAIRDGAGGGGGGTGLSGAGSPEGVQTAAVGTTYWDTTGEVFWVKNAGVGNTGWFQLVG